MKRFSLLGLGLGTMGLASAAHGADPFASQRSLPTTTGRGALVTIQSGSGQFQVQGSTWNDRTTSTNRDWIVVDPALLAVSCEQIKRQLLGALHIPDQWRHPIFLGIQPARSEDPAILIQSVRFPDAWQYRLRVPRHVQRDRLVQAVVEVLLLELSQRERARDPVDLPPWLGVGMAAALQSGAIGSLLLESKSAVAGPQRTVDPLLEVRQHLRQHTPLTLDQLSWPDAALEDGPEWETYRHSAHLLVHHLLNLRGGDRRMLDLLQSLPAYRNWQTAFLRTYQSQFPQLIDLDKWWSLNLVHVMGQSVSFNWSFEESWRKLEEILSAQVHVRTRTDEMPMATRTTIQSVLTQLEYSHQAPLLRLKMNHLAALQFRATPVLASTIDAYRQALGEYLTRRERLGGSEDRTTTVPPGISLVVEETVAQLDELDARLRELKRLLQIAAKAQ